ncbi:MAG: HEAT repeat domain-containing protein [Planctomycetes bacterium]|nr:HEAT repeat domain-containing protein [Planctomycetota bacterium]
MKSSVFRIYSFFFYLFILSVVACSQEAKNPSLAAAGPIETEASAREFRIYRDALQQGSTDDIRVDAAVGLLLQNDGQGRDALLLALKSEENPQARQAVCKALIKSRVLSQTIDSLDIFQEPLLRILRGESTEQAKLSAEAMLVFDYSVVAGSLDQIIQNKEIDHQIRMNAVYALQLRPEPTALRGLIKLLDGPDAEVAKAAETALQEAFGIPVGASRTVWLGILDELQLKSPEDIRRERLLRQEMKLRQVQSERDRWQKLYLSALDKQYESLDEANRGEIILDTMGFDLAPVRLWALSKASKYPVIGEGLREKLLSLLSDSSREVRLQAAKSLMNMSALNPAAVLLERLKLEEDAEVKLVMLEALGEACFFAFSPGSPIKLSESIKIETLEIAAGYLQSESSVDCIKGAGIIRKILELNNLSSDSMQSYLGLLNDRYQKSISLDKELRAELLAILAHLCGQGGAKDSACILFGPLFMDATAVENDPALRLAAVQGISYVDKVRALELFKKNSLMRDPSLAVQQVVIDVAGQTGDTTDLEWLLVLLNGNGHSDRVWLAIKSICQRQEAGFLLDWLPGLEGTGAAKGEYVRDILDIAEQKAAGKKDQELLVRVREQIIFRLVKAKAWEQASAYLSGINYSLSEKLYSDRTNFEAFNVYLYDGEPKKAVEYIESRLGLSDIKKDSPLAAMIKGYFSEKEIEHASKMLFFEKMSSISKEERPNWSVFMGDLDRQLNPPASQEPEVPEGGTGE